MSASVQQLLLAANAAMLEIFVDLANGLVIRVWKMFGRREDVARWE